MGEKLKSLVLSVLVIALVFLAWNAQQTNHRITVLENQLAKERLWRHVQTIMLRRVIKIIKKDRANVAPQNTMRRQRL